MAEDALERIVVEYEPLPVVADPGRRAGRRRAADPPGARLQRRAPTGRFSYGDPDAAFARADLVLRERFRHPRSAATPVECYGVVADWEPAGDAVTAWSNFQGPFTLHGVAAAALGIRPARLRLLTPADSGGSFGVKSGVYVYVVLLAIASRRFGVPVRWTEDRVEHLLRVVERHRAADARSRPRSPPTASCSGCGSTSSTTSAPTCARPSRPRSTACTAA